MAAPTDRRGVIAALEKYLAENVDAAGYDMMKMVNCSKSLDGELCGEVQAAFTAELRRL